MLAFAEAGEMVICIKCYLPFGSILLSNVLVIFLVLACIVLGYTVCTFCFGF
jgi:hypothetical protein